MTTTRARRSSASPTLATPGADATPAGHLIGYARVSTKDQDHALQLDALNAAQCQKIFEDTKSGKNTDRDGLTAALDYLRPGDTLCVWKLDRLGRSTRDILNIAHDLAERGVGLRILSGTLTGDYSPTGQGKVFFTIMAAFAELERDLIVERTRAGLEVAKAQGRTLGRPTALSEDQMRIARARRAEGESVTSIAKVLGVSRATMYNYFAAEAVES